MTPNTPHESCDMRHERMVVLFAAEAIHAGTGDAWAASIRAGMGQLVASMRREMDVPEQVEAYLASQPGPKQADLRRLHAHILAEFPGCRLWFTDGTNADGKVVARLQGPQERRARAAGLSSRFAALCSRRGL